MSTTLRLFRLDSSLHPSHYHDTHPSHLLSLNLPKTNTKSKSSGNVIGLKNVENYTVKYSILHLQSNLKVPHLQRPRRSQCARKSLNRQEKFWQRKVKNERKSSAQNFFLRPRCSQWGAGKSLNGQEKFRQRKVKSERKSSAQNFSPIQTFPCPH